MSAPLLKPDALRLINVVMALLEWQSTLAYLKDPPPGYLLSATDLMSDAQTLRVAVENDAFTSELAFEKALTDILESSHDGHLYTSLPAMRVFGYIRTIDGIVSVSLDGRSTPDIFAYGDIEQRNADNNFNPSPIVKINGQDAKSWVLYQALNTTSGQHDPDAMYSPISRLNSTIFANVLRYNTFVKSPAAGSRFLFCGSYPGPSTTILFKNGTVLNHPTTAVLLDDFTGVVDGRSFYRRFVTEVTRKRALSSRGTVSALGHNTIHEMRKTAASHHSNDLYPAPLYFTDDGAIEGYFMNVLGFETVAVLRLGSFNPRSTEEFHSNLTEFLHTCVLNGKQHLIVDIQSNGGGNIGLGYDVFEQLFPDTEPYSAGNLRSHEQLNVMGEFFTQFAHGVLEDTGNITNYIAAGGFSAFDGRGLNNLSGQRFDSWSEFTGPTLSHGDTFTNLALLDIENTDYEDYLSGFVFSKPPRQAFQTENIIVLSNGNCGSTCDTFMNLMKWQGGVKTIVGGGRPKPGPMQFVGGVKGRRKLSIGYLMYMVNLFYQHAPPDIQANANQTKLKEVADNGEYLSRRSDGTFAVNFGNGIAKDDVTMTPLQFVYEAADCRVWWKPEHFFDTTTLWSLVAGTAFGLNNTEKWAACVAGSTNHPSSVSGGMQLVFTYNGTLQPPSDGKNNQSSVAKADPDPKGVELKNSAKTFVQKFASIPLFLGAVMFGGILNLM
ncbi:uncharacterized protein A1O9_01220 [Exophiala aquamarina CBS 119918]|uniref:Uncharacterized protein n=1 Tax=Exophiala aquamarina CBS 119918 TaxID=1182545 RepID=A0A072PV82_9EURO|nr:uncharacterized protein A1O9_01220 [Exophiala aquamarina CBS 119918]KEF63243.1 hypothetical protein A1O9_01220 [Exophiala aquamarina CBS 119918]